MIGETDSSDGTSRRRSRLVLLLGRMDTPITVDELVDELERDAARRPGISDRGGSWEDLHQSLHDEDLPALDRAGLLTFDEERGLVSQTGAYDPDLSVGEPTDNDDFPSVDGTDPHSRVVARYHLGVAALSAVVLAAATLDVGPFAAVPRDTVATALVVVLVVSSVVTALSHRA